MSENKSLAVVTRFVDALYRCGVRQVCLSPGSRSTPLTMAFARHGEFRIWSILDERSAGFFAIGAARATREPVVLVCTSGTATGNYLPAAMEAHNARLPLLFLTADRPPELHGVGANQTVQQQGLYGSFPGLTLQMPVPDGTQALTRHAESVVLRVAAHLARGNGPVHVNWPFREPLVPPIDTEAATNIPRTFVQSAPPVPAADAIEMLARDFRRAKRGVIVAGPTLGRSDVLPLLRLAKQLQWPILADALSGIRSLAGADDADVIVDSYDAFLRSPRIRSQVVPDIILRFGGTPTSKALGRYVSEHASSRQVVVDAHEQWNDAFFTATDLIISDEAAFCDAMAGALAAAPGLEPESESESERTATDWLPLWQQLNGETQSVLGKQLQGGPWFEGAIYRPLLNALPEGANLFIGNSMPVRDLETLFGVQAKALTVLANRGVSGIDGVTSAACGAAAASQRFTALVIGDVSFYHDLNALLLPSRTRTDLLIVVPNNDGGGIFSFLPPATYPDTFEHFQTAHGLSYEHVAQQFGARYLLADDMAGYEAALAEAVPLSGLRIIELTFDVQANIDAHKVMFQQVRERVEPLSR